jgi:hypothetical protein
MKKLMMGSIASGHSHIKYQWHDSSTRLQFLLLCHRHLLSHHTGRHQFLHQQQKIVGA